MPARTFPRFSPGGIGPDIVIPDNGARNNGNIYTMIVVKAYDVTLFFPLFLR